jgi:hypothetical protein
VADVPVWQGQVLPTTTPRRLRLRLAPAAWYAGLTALTGGLFAIGVRSCLEEGVRDGLFLVLFFGAILLGIAIRLSFVPRERRLLRTGTLRVAVVSPDRQRGTFQDGEGSEHTVSLAPLPDNVGPGMKVPVVYREDRPGGARSVGGVFFEIVPVGPSEEPLPPLPRIAPVWRGVPVPEATPRRVIPTRKLKLLLAFLIVLFVCLEAPTAMGLLTTSGQDLIWVVVLEVGLLGSALGLAWLVVRGYRLVQWGHVATAHVLSRRERHAQHGVTIHEITFAFEVGGRRFECTGVTQPGDTGPTVPVFYDAANPKRNVLISALLYEVLPGPSATSSSPPRAPSRP